MQAVCATCAVPLAFTVPELTNGLWHVNCSACGKDTALEANPCGQGEDLATFHAAGVYQGRVD
jgi:hypothetical protein